METKLKIGNIGCSYLGGVGAVEIDGIVSMLIEFLFLFFLGFFFGCVGSSLLRAGFL